MHILFWLLLGFVGVIWLWVRWSKLGRLPEPDVPGPKGWPILGDFSGILDRTTAGLTTRFAERAKQYPRICKSVSILLTSYSVNDATLVKKMTQDDAKLFQNHPMFRNADKILTNKGLIGIRDEEWRNRRKLLAPHFTGTKVLPMIPEIFAQHAATLVERVEQSKDGETINLHRYFTNLTMDVIGDAGFGTSFDSQKLPDNLLSKSIQLWIEAAAKIGLAALFPFWDKIPMQMIKDFLNGQNKLVQICTDVMKERIKTGERRNDLLQSLVDMSDTVPHEDLMGEALLFLIAGHETTSSTLTWASYLLARHPEIERKLVQELKEVLKGEQPNEENVHQLKYMEYVINETLRLNPPALLTSRENQENVEFDGYIFPARSFFLIPIWVLHHDERYWPDPEKFDPERWTPENKAKHVPGAYLPFGLGPRMCIGYKFSLVESKVALAMLYQKFTFKYTQKNDPVVLPGSLWRPNELLMDVYRRQN